MKGSRLSATELAVHLSHVPDDARRTVTALRKVILSAAPTCSEAIKFRVLCYYHDDAYLKSIGGNICMIEAKGGKVVLSFIRGATLPDPKGLQRTGLTLLAFLRATPDYARIPVLIFTGVPLSAEEETLARKHEAEVFYKPQAYSTLIASLSRLLVHPPATITPLL